MDIFIVPSEFKKLFPYMISILANNFEFYTVFKTII